MKRAVLVCDASRARLFASVGPHEPLRLLHSEDNPLGRARAQDLQSDEPGRYSEGGKGGILSAMEPPPAHEVEAERFARHLADVLLRSHERREFESVAIVAPPHFLGLLRDTLNPAVERVASWIAKDLTKLEPKELLEHLAPTLWPGS